MSGSTRVFELRHVRELIELLDQAVIVRDPAESRITCWNCGAVEIYGYTQTETHGRVTHDLLATEFPDCRRAVDDALLAHGRWSGALRQLNKDGHWILVGSRQILLRDERGEPFAVIEVNSIARTQRRLDEASRRLAAIVEHSEDAILAKSSEGIITEWNRGAERLYGYTADEAIGRPVTMLMVPERASEELRTLDQVLRGETIAQYETTRLRKDGTPVEVSLTVSPIRNRSGAVVATAAIARNITDRVRHERQLRYLADHDSLTGLFNRRRFEEELRRELAWSRRYEAKGAVLAIDIDHFKYMNDSFGHLAGDAIIATAAETFRSRLRATDVIARIGGDEFAAILHDVDEHQARLVAVELLEAIRMEGTFTLPGTERRVTASIGIASFTHTEAISPDDVLAEADVAMYDAKEAGRNRIAVYHPANGSQGIERAHLKWGTRVRRAPVRTARGADPRAQRRRGGPA